MNSKFALATVTVGLSSLLTTCGVVSDANICRAQASVCAGTNRPPVALAGEAGSGDTYEPSQLGGLSFTRYGESGSLSNQVSHNEMMDFLDDPVGNADGVRADGTVAQRDYRFSGSSDPGWQVSNQNDKYADGNDEITPVPGGDFFGDTYRGYFVPDLDGVYQFTNTILPDNGVRIMMSPNECQSGAVAVLSTDFAGYDTLQGTSDTRTSGATDAASIWINGNGGTFRQASVGSFNNTPDNEYAHNTRVFFPGGASNPDYADGEVYLKAGRVYYIEIRYSEGGGGNAFEFGYRRKNFGGVYPGSATNLSALSMMPYSGADRYISREACGGSYNASVLFSDPDGDTLKFSARLVTSTGATISGSAGKLSYLGLSIDPATGAVSGTVNSNYTSQKIVFGATDEQGTNTKVEASAVAIIR